MLELVEERKKDQNFLALKKLGSKTATPVSNKRVVASKSTTPVKKPSREERESDSESDSNNDDDSDSDDDLFDEDEANLVSDTFKSSKSSHEPPKYVSKPQQKRTVEKEEGEEEEDEEIGNDLENSDKDDDFDYSSEDEAPKTRSKRFVKGQNNTPHKEMPSSKELSSEKSVKSQVENLSTVSISNTTSPESDNCADIRSIWKVQIRRHQMIQWFYEPFFDKVLPSSFVRILVGENNVKQPIYRMCEISGIEKTGRIYKIPDSKIQTDVRLIVRIGTKSKHNVKIDKVSNSRITEKEYKKYIQDLKSFRKNLLVPSEGKLVVCYLSSRIYVYIYCHLRSFINESFFSSCSVPNCKNSE